MQFQVTERITSNAPSIDVGKSTIERFRSIASSAVVVGEILRVIRVHATFGSINRYDVTDIAIRPLDDGYLLIADVKYRPSAEFWFFLVLGLFTGIFWLLPVGFYLIQIETVKKGIKEGFLNIKNEFSRAPTTQLNTNQTSTLIADLERLGSLLQKGLLTQGEFDSQKLKLLRGEPQDTSANTAQPDRTDRLNYGSIETIATASQWFYKVMGEEVGPLTGDSLRSLASNGTIERDTIVRRGDRTWVLAESMKGLFPADPRIS